MNRIIIDSTDRTRELNNYHADTVILSTESAIYISSFFKFNHIYFDLKTPEVSEVSDAAVHLCTSVDFENVLDVVDETYGFTRSGFIYFTPNRSSAWTASDTINITELSTFDIRNRYWVKITGTFTALKINWIGQIFSNDDDLKDEFPNLCEVDMFDALGTTDHKLLHIRAGELIINQLKTKNIIYNESQLLDRSDYRAASVMKVAELIYFSLGDAYLDKTNECRKEYNDRLAKTQPKIDIKNNAEEMRASGTVSMGRLYR
jgi:hypothetical protein